VIPIAPYDADVYLIHVMLYRLASDYKHFVVLYRASGGARKISLPGHNRGTIISNGAHAIGLIMTNALVGGPLT